HGADRDSFEVNSCRIPSGSWQRDRLFGSMMTPRSIVKAAVSRYIPLGMTSHLCAPVLTYHACFEDVPECVAPIDNVSPQRMYEQLRSLKKAYRFVPVDELCES